jgi:putative DNA primase/helicase
MAGTTNEDEFLMDPTGWRRYHPVAVGCADLDWIAEHREQLFAEAVVRYRAGERWWYDEGTPEAERLARLVAPFQSTHPWEEVLYGWLLARKTAEPFTAVEVLRAALGRTPGDLTHAEKTVVGHILVHRLKCPKQRGAGGAMEYLRPLSMPAVTGPTKVIEYPQKGA